VGKQGNNLDSKLITQYQAWLQRLARSLVRDSSRADDVIQNVWLSALHSKAPLKKNKDLRPWLKVVTKNVLSQIKRADLRRTARERKDPKPELFIEASFLQQRETVSILEKIVSELEEPYRSVVRQRFFEDLSIEEIAQKQGIYYDTAKTRLRRALGQLREILDKRYGSREVWTVFFLPLCKLQQPATGATASATAKWTVGICAGVLAFVPAFVAIYRPGEPNRSNEQARVVLEEKNKMAGAAVSESSPHDELTISISERANPFASQSQNPESVESPMKSQAQESLATGRGFHSENIKGPKAMRQIRNPYFVPSSKYRLALPEGPPEANEVFWPPNDGKVSDENEQLFPRIQDWLEQQGQYPQ